MRAPVIHVLGKPPADFKGGSSNSNNYEHPHPHGWEKRGSGRYHDEWEKRGSLGGSGGTSNVLRISEGSRNSIFSGDSGRPPGRGEEGEEAPQSGVVTPTPVILSRARSSSEQRSTSPNPAVVSSRLVLHKSLMIKYIMPCSLCPTPANAAQRPLLLVILFHTQTHTLLPRKGEGVV